MQGQNKVLLPQDCVNRVCQCRAEFAKTHCVYVVGYRTFYTGDSRTEMTATLPEALAYARNLIWGLVSGVTIWERESNHLVIDAHQLMLG